MISLAVVVGIFVPRFGIKSPSLVDDWFALTYAPTAVHQLLHGHYDAAVVDYGGRYRPSYALLADVQWMFGSRTSTLVPNLFGLARLLFFAGVVAAIVVAMLRGTASRAWLIVAASIVPTMVVAAPGVSYNFLRFGVAEPTAFAAVAIGLTAMTAAVQTAVGSEPKVVPLRTATIFVAGFAVYAFGAYMSEACAAVIVLLPSLYYWISHKPGFTRGRRSGAILAIAATLVLLPIAHVAWEVESRLGSDHGRRTIGGAIHQFVRPLGPTASGMLTTGDLIWPIVVATTLALSVRRALQKDRHGILLTGMSLSGIAAAYIATLGTDGISLSRYYIPLLVAAGTAFVWLLVDLKTLQRSLVSTAVLLLILAGRGDLRARAWLEGDHGGDRAIAFASAASATGCSVYLVDFPTERRMGLARVLDRRSSAGSLATCRAPSRSAYAVWWRLYSATQTATAPPGCATQWRRVSDPGSVELLRCSNFEPEGSIPTQDTLRQTRMARLAPPSHWINAGVLNRLPYADR